MKQALLATAHKRGSDGIIADYRNVMKSVSESRVMQEQWGVYQHNFEYASDVALQDTCNTVVQIMDALE